MTTARSFAPVLTADEAEMHLVRRARIGDPSAFRAIMKCHNQRLYRIARSVLRNDADAEDVVQEAYLRAFAHLDDFRGDASLSTWLSRIVLNEALGRLRHQRRQRRDSSMTVAADPERQVIAFPLNSSADDPERTMAQRQLLQLVERATDNLAEIYRAIFVARVIEGLTVEQTAELFDLQAATVKTRLHRARALLRQELDAQIGPVLLNAFPFAGRRCDRLAAAVMRRLGLPE